MRPLPRQVAAINRPTHRIPDPRCTLRLVEQTRHAVIREQPRIESGPPRRLPLRVHMERTSLAAIWRAVAVLPR